MFKIMEDILKKYSEKIEQNSVLSNNGECVLWVGRSLSKDGLYGVINAQLNGPRTPWSRVTAHRLAFMISNKNFTLDRNVDVSHLCHNSKCVNPEPLSAEPRGLNNTRKNCASEKRCLGHPPYPNCLTHLLL